jgi:hypothetical protein
LSCSLTADDTRKLELRHFLLLDIVLMCGCSLACVFPSAGQKGSDVTAREATRKMVSAATQLDALEKVAARVDAIAAAHGVEVQHMQRPHQLPAGVAAAGKAGAADAAEQEQEGLVPRSASAVVQPNLWQPKNTIVRGAFKESVLAAMQQQQMLTQSADQECRIDQSHKQHRGR